jgi:hypothetical protein
MLQEGTSVPKYNAPSSAHFILEIFIPMDKNITIVAISKTEVFLKVFFISFTKIQHYISI